MVPSYYWTRRCFLNTPLLTDIEAYPQYPWARWVYNKLLLSQALRYECAPHGILPKKYPVFSKPIINLEGMALGSRVWNSADDVEYIPGHFWMPYFTGEHCSYDIQLKGGKVIYCKKAIARLTKDHKVIEHWLIVNSDLGEAESLWKNLLPEFSGHVNFETIDGNIFEVHLRWAAEWYDWYDNGMLLFYSVPVWWKTLPQSFDTGISRPETVLIKDVSSDITNNNLQCKRSHIILSESLTMARRARDEIISLNTKK
jgi:hypothetical protein